MKLETKILAFLLMNILFFAFGIITISNPVLNILLFGEGSWIDLFQLRNIFSTTGLILSGVAILGIVLKNDKLIFAGLCSFLLGYGAELYPIVFKFPSPFGHILYGLMMFLYLWTIIEWWRGKDG